MAASMFRGHGKLMKNIYHKCRISAQPKRHISESFIVLLPETPPDTEETNAIMRYKNYPEFLKISPEKVIRGGAKRSLEFEVELDKHITKFEDKSYPRTFESVFNRMEEILEPVMFSLKTGKQLADITSNQDYEYAFERIERQGSGALRERFDSEIFLNVIKELSADQSLTEQQRRLVDMYMNHYAYNGLLLPPKKRREYFAIWKQISSSVGSFGYKVAVCMELFEYPLDEYSLMENLPQSLLYYMAEDQTKYDRGPWKVKLYEPIYTDFMSHCPDRMARWNIWWAKVNVSSHMHHEQFLNNNETITEVRSRRRIMANVRDFKTYADMVQSRNMAGGVDNVMELLENVKMAAYPKAEAELTELQDHASNAFLFTEELKPWDYLFYATQIQREITGYTPDGIMEYFPFPVVLKGLLDLCTKLYGVQFTNNKSAQRWHEDIIVYDLLNEEGEHISTLYIDPYLRRGKRDDCAVEMGAARCDHTGSKPWSYMGLNIIPPSPGNPDDPAYMTHKNVKDLFETMGHALQQLLTTVPYLELSGQQNIELDTIYVPAKVMGRWLTRPEVLSSISLNAITGKPMSEELANKIIKADTVFSGYTMCKQLYKSAFDIEAHVHTWKTHWHSIFEKTYRHFVPDPLEKEDFSPNCYADIFASPIGGSYYGLVWSEMLAADIFSAFEEAGFDNEQELIAINKRYRDTYYGLGGSIPAREVFRRFRGRDPSVQPLLEQFKSS